VTFGVRTVNQDGSQPFPVQMLGQVSGLRYATAWPFGCTTASFDLDVPEGFSHFALKPGRIAEVYDGIHRVWGGTVQDPQRGTPWHVQMTGCAALADDYQPLTSAAVPTADPTTAVDEAILRGLPWLRRAALPAQAGAAGQTPNSLTQVLNDATAAVTKRWAIFADRQLITASDPTTPTYVLIAADTPGSRTVDNYVTDLYLRYYDNATTPALVKTVVASTPYRPFGRYERLVDITAQGAISAVTAQSSANAQLAASTRNLTYSGQVLVQPGALLNRGGVPVSLSTVRAGRMIEPRGASQDPTFGELYFTTVIRWVIGDCEYDVDSDTLTLAPVGAKPNDLTSVLARVMGSPTDTTSSPAYA
jgi:hypothetical protein